MKLIVKSLLGGSATIEVTGDTLIYDLKKQVESSINIPASQQSLVFSGKPLQDDKTLSFYQNITEGSKIFAAIKKQESLNQVLGRFLRSYYTEEQSRVIVDEFMKDFHRKVTSLSLDDLERLAKADIDAVSAPI